MQLFGLKLHAKKGRNNGCVLTGLGAYIYGGSENDAIAWLRYAR